jgi:undecaprenyl-diphosphatase
MAMPAFRPDQWVVLTLAAAAVLLLIWGAPDLAIATFDAGLDPRFIDAMGRAAELGDSRWTFIPAGTLLLVLVAARSRVRRGRRLEACDWVIALSAFLIVAVALSGLTVDLVKLLVGRTRPNLVGTGVAYGFDPLRFDAAYQSFPSGHANTLLVLGLVGTLLARRLAVALLALAMMLSLGRVAASAHYLSDLLGAAAIAVATTFWLRERFAARGWVFAPGRGVGVNRTGRLIGRWLRWRLRRGARRVFAPRVAARASLPRLSRAAARRRS